MVRCDKFNKMEELFNKWLESKDTTENIINHLKGQKSFHLDFLKYVTKQCNIPVVVLQSEQLKCQCCDGTGIVEGENYDDKQSCLTCNGRGYFN